MSELINQYKYRIPKWKRYFKVNLKSLIEKNLVWLSYVLFKTNQYKNTICVINTFNQLNYCILIVI